MAFDYEKAERFYDEMCPGRQIFVKPVMISKEQYIQNWINEEYEKWKIDENLVKGEFYTMKGERVRSKSEKIIADELTRYGIPYRYEYPLQLMDGSRLIKIRPDFYVLNPKSLEEKVIEHMGMLDKEHYFNENMDKISLYERNGLLLGANLIILHETARFPINTKIIDQYIETNFL